MSAICDREIYREKAAEMRHQAARAETSYLRAIYQEIANEWDLTADAIEVAVPLPVTVAKTAESSREFILI